MQTPRGCSNGWQRRRLYALGVALMLLSGCASQGSGCKLDPKLLPPLPTYEVKPVEIPCNLGEVNHGQRRCYLKLVEDEQSLILYAKTLCFTLTGDKAACGMTP